MFQTDEYVPLRPGGRSLTKELLLLAGDIRGCRVLDLGCGYGETADLITREYGAAVTGADLSAAHIRKCRETYSGIEFVTADGQDLPFADRSFGILISECSFSLFPDPLQAFREAYRVLDHGGILLLSDLWKRDGEAEGSGTVRHLYTRRTWQDMTSSAGFRLKEFIDVRDALTEMYVQMIFDLGLEEAQKKTGLCLAKEEMKHVSYMLMSAQK